jgi:carboxypeptidase C (cathepsin A)
MRHDKIPATSNLEKVMPRLGFVGVLGLMGVFFFPAVTPAQRSSPHEESTQADQAEPAVQGPDSAPKPETPKEKEKPEEPPVVTHHDIHIQGRPLKYTATAGLMPIKNEEGETEAHMFFVAYTLENAGSAGPRPITFAFNGGPGSASVWLHLGVIGPRKVVLKPDGVMPPPPFQLEDNPYTWLDQTDLVFIDPVGTGYSRATKKEFARKFWSVNGDIASVGEFIRLYLTRYQRWTSPIFLAGESYGTTRAAGLSSYLLEHGIALNGIVLVSTVLNFQTLEFTKGNDLPYVLYLPTYTATAWYHKKLPAELQNKELASILPEVEHWAETDYLAALEKGDSLTETERQSVLNHLARFTGLPAEYIANANLRINASNFEKQLLLGEGHTVGRLDSRFEGTDASGVSAMPDYDPLISEERPPFTSAFSEYVRSDLGYKTDEPYYVLGGGVRQWDWGSAEHGFPNVEPDLRSAFVQNHYMKLFVASGYFDLGTPFFATKYTLNHLGFGPKLHAQISTGEYGAGHMIYIDEASLQQFRKDVAAFIDASLK